MPGLGITTETDQPSVSVETNPLMIWTNPATGSQVSNSFITNITGANTGSVGATLVGTDKYASIPGILVSRIKGESNVDPLVAEEVLNNIEIYTTIYNITRGTQLSLPKFNPIVSNDPTATSLTYWNLESDTMDASLYDDIRSLTTGPDALIKPSTFPAGASVQSRTSVDFTFTGCFSSEFEISWYIKSLYTGASIKGDTRRDVEGILGNQVFQRDLVFPERAVHTGDPIFTQSYVEITIDPAIPAEDPIVISGVPVRLVSNDTFDVTDKNGNKMDLTGTFEWIDNNGAEQSVSFPQSLTDTASMVISLKVLEPVESATVISSEIIVCALVT